MKQFNKWVQRMGFAATLAAGQMAWTFEPIPPQPPPAPPENLVVTRTTRSFLGIGVQEIDADRAKALNLREERGVEVTRVEEDSPATKGGLRTGDVVLEFNGERVEGVEQFMRMVRETPPGREVKLSVMRNGSPQQIALRTGTRKSVLNARFSEFGSFELPRIEMPEINLPDIPRPFMTWRSTVIGIEGESLESQLAEYFGVKEGVLVRSVVKNSAGDKAGLRAGDVIVKVDESKVASLREISSGLRAARGKKVLPLAVVREKRELTLQLAVDEALSENRSTGSTRK